MHQPTKCIDAAFSSVFGLRQLLWEIFGLLNDPLSSPANFVGLLFGTGKQCTDGFWSFY